MYKSRLTGFMEDAAEDETLSGGCGGVEIFCRWFVTQRTVKLIHSHDYGEFYFFIRWFTSYAEKGTMRIDWTSRFQTWMPKFEKFLWISTRLGRKITTLSHEIHVRDKKKGGKEKTAFKRLFSVIYTVGQHWGKKKELRCASPWESKYIFIRRRTFFECRVNLWISQTAFWPYGNFTVDP